MLKLNESFQSVPVMSLRIGGPIARILTPIINPNNLYIEGWYVIDNRSGEKLILLSKDIRDIIPQGLVVNDHEDLIDPNELVRLKEILDLKFNPIGLKVISESKHSYGKVQDFAFDTSNFYIQKIYSGQPVIRSLSGGNISIDRSQIVEITNRRIVIEDPTVKSEEKSLAPAPANL